ncbi:MAG: transglutaminase domain-containing protein [Oscillospiraceae bacterium]
MSKGITMRILPLITAFAFLTGCSDSGGNDMEPQEIQYKVITGSGNSVYPIDEGKYSSPVETEYISVPGGMTTRFGYDQLDKSGKDIYNLILNAVKNCGETAEIPNIDSSGKLYNRILELIRFENPAMFHIESREIGRISLAAQSFDIKFSYKYSAEEVNIMLRETEKAADKIMVQITADMDEYDIVKLFHDSLIINCKNDENGQYVDNVYGALVDGKALCEGYAKAFSYLCGRAGIENVIVTGKTTTDHMWNMVKLDGNWYHVDVTWDHPSAIITDAYPDAVMYNYFLISDADAAENRTIDNDYFEPPRATGSVMNYFYHEGMYADSYDAALNCIKNGCEGAVADERHSFMIKLASDDLYETVIGNLSSGPDLSGVMSEAGFTGRISYTNMYSSDRIIMFMLEY